MYLYFYIGFNKCRWLIIIILILVLCLFSNVELFQKENDEIPESNVDNMYTLTKYMNKFFPRHIPYWIIGGTLTGALRNTPPGPIKWDDDIDVAILKRDKELFEHALNTDDHFNTLVDWAITCFGWTFKLKGVKNSYKKYYYDVFVYEKAEGKFGTKLYTAKNYDIFQQYYYNGVEEIFPLKQCPFWDLILPCPNNLDTVHRGYDDVDVLKYAQKYNHTTKSKELIDVTKNINRGYTIPLLSKKLVAKLYFLHRGFKTTKTRI